MEKHVSIKRIKELDEGLNFDKLRLEGFAKTQQLSGAIWTDYNEHDPGVTLLEYLCFTLTDLAYRSNFAIEDLLYAEDGPGHSQINNGFFAPVDILPTTPVTPIDYRRLLIDQVRGIRNAWFEPISGHNRGYRGLFRVRIQLTDGIDRHQRGDKIVDEVRQIMMANRNLCEDLHEIVVLKTEHLSLSATISIDGDAFGEKVIAGIIHTVEQLLNPGIRFYSLEELKEEGYGTEDIFDGPTPRHGFIKKEDLRPLPESAHLSTIREAISKVKGVKLIDQLTVWKNGQRVTGDEILPAKNSALSLDHKLLDASGAEGGLILLRNGIPVSIDVRHARQYLNTLSAKAKKGFQTHLNLSTKPTFSSKNRRQIAAYKSFQRLLPSVYGLGQNGLPPTANRKRRAQAYQLRAYLLIFEQFMADYLAQLSHVRDLFSISPDGAEDATFEGHPSTYFTQFPTDIPEAEHLFYHGMPENTPPEKIISKINADLQQLCASSDPASERRDRFLDHMLARFGETFTGDFLRFRASLSREQKLDALIKAKARFLSDYPTLSRDRSKGFNYRKSAWENSNVSGLKKRIFHTLDLGKFASHKAVPMYANRSLYPIHQLAGIKLETDENIKIPLRVSLLNLLRDGVRTSGYSILKNGRKFDLVWQLKTINTADPYAADAGAYNENHKQNTIIFTGTQRQCAAARDNLISRLQQINQQSEGLFFIENILLRPEKKPGAVLVLEIPLPDGGGSVCLRSLAFTSERALYELSTDILVVSTQKTNWSAIQINDDWRMVLLQAGIPILISTPYATAMEAREAGEQVRNRCEAIRNHDPAAINNYLRLESERFPGFNVSSAFYSLRLSIIIPAWPAIFQNQDFHQLVHQTVAASVPAHLSVDYYWLEPGEMITFEGLYKQWLEAKQAKNSDLAQELSIELIYFLQPEWKPDVTQKREQVHDKLPPIVFNQLGQSFGYAFVFEQDDFSVIQGLPKPIASLFPEIGIHNWTDLRQKSTEPVVAKIHEAGLPATKSRFENWQKQASLAAANRWNDLLRYQRRSVNAGALMALDLKGRTKVEQAVQNNLRTPSSFLDAIARWVDRFDKQRFIPYELLSFLTQTFGYGFIIPSGDLEIYTGVEPEEKRHFAQLEITTRQQLAELQPGDWLTLTEKFKVLSPTLDLVKLQAEVKLSAAGQWEQLVSLQTPAGEDRSVAPVEQRLVLSLEQLMAPIEEGERLLAARLRSWKTILGDTKIPSSATNALLELLSYDDILAEDNLNIFDGLGQQTATILNSFGIKTWANLADQDPKALRHTLRKDLSPGSMKQLEEWIKQARMANNGQWEALIDWQKGPIEPPNTSGKELTALELGLLQWLQQHAQQEDKNTPS